jgi:hypothetical protein
MEKQNITAPLITRKGAHFIDYVEENPNNVFIAKTEDNGSNNPARFVTDMSNVDAIADSFRTTGQDLSLTLPVVSKLRKPLIISGKVYTHKLVAGHHRVAAAIKAGLETLVFSLYEFDDDRSRIRFQMKENNHAPAKGASADDLAESIGYAIEKGFIGNTEEEMDDWLSDMTHVHKKTKGAAKKKAIRANGTYQDIMVYTAEDVKEKVSNEGYKIAGHYDPVRKKAGWAIKEGYEYEYVVNAIRKFNELGQESYFLLHTKAPTEGRDLNDKRESMVEEIARLETALESVIQYREKTGRFPWVVEGFLPQDNKSGETQKGIISL